MFYDMLHGREKALIYAAWKYVASVYAVSEDLKKKI